MKKRVVSLALAFSMLIYGMRLCGISTFIYASTSEPKLKVTGDKQGGSVRLKNVKRAQMKKNDRLEKVDKKDNYLVVASDETNRRMVEKRYPVAESIGQTSEGGIQKEDITVVRMSGNQACELQDESGILRVEKDETVKASGWIHGREQKKKKMNSKEAEWNLQTIKADKVDKSMKSGKEKQRIKVAVIDSGVDVANDLLVMDTINLIPGEEELLPLFSDITGHGTSVAGIIAAEENDIGITGINPRAEIYAARVLDNNNQAPISRVVEGIYWAINHDVHIINMSFGMAEDSVILRKAIQDAYSEGILLVASAGNTGAEVEYPAAYPEVLAVGAVDSKGKVCEESATEKEVELVAPGEKVKSTAGFGTTLICSGTSMAAPHVAGVASLLWEKDLSMSSEFIRKLLDVSANHYNEDMAYGYGLIDAKYALSLYDEFKATYQNEAMENITLDEVEEAVLANESEVVVYEQNDYVEGRWTGVGHENTITRTDLVKMKQGTVYPDKSDYLKKISKHGAFHGRGNIYETRITDVGNYVANTIYLSLIAQRGELITYQESGMLTTHYDSNQLNEFSHIYKQLGLCEIDIDNVSGARYYKNDKSFLWGIAIHCATDAYAHSAFAKIKNVWYRIKHPAVDTYGSGTITGNTVTGADDYQFALGRWFCAQHVAENMINIYLSGDITNKVTYKTFLVDDYKRAEAMEYSELRPAANLPFKLYKLYDYASKTQNGTMNEQGMLFEKTMWFWK